MFKINVVTITTLPNCLAFEVILLRNLFQSPVPCSSLVEVNFHWMLASHRLSHSFCGLQIRALPESLCPSFRFIHGMWTLSWEWTGFWEMLQTCSPTLYHGVCVSSPGLACVWCAEKGIHGNVWYALKVMAKLEPSGLKGGYLKVWMLGKPLIIKSCSVSSLNLFFAVQSLFIISGETRL